MHTGLKHTSTLTVSQQHTAQSLGSGDLPVLATPQMVALMENAAMMAVNPELDPAAATVGAMINTTHLRPTPTGDTIAATACLTEVDGRKLTFSITAADSKGTIGEATHVRYIVNRDKFMSRCTESHAQ